MGLVTTRVYAEDQNTDPVENIVVQVYDDADTFVTQNLTTLVGGEAYAEFSLDGDGDGVSYTIRLSKVDVAFDGLLGDSSKTPQAILVFDPPSAAPSGTNDFTVLGQTFERPASTDARLCKASGFFKDASGRARSDLDIKFVPQFEPLIVDGNAVMGYQVQGKTDDDGYFEVELYREGHYMAVLEAIDDIPRDVTVPDLSSCNLIYLLFPTVASVAYSPSSVSISVGEEEEITLTITTTSGVVLDPTAGDVTFSSNDTNVATVLTTSDGTILVTGVATGSTSITPEAADDTIITIPPVSLDDLSVTVG